MLHSGHLSGSDARTAATDAFIYESGHNGQLLKRYR